MGVRIREVLLYLHIEGKICKSFCASHFNKEASKNYQQLSDMERAMLEQDNPLDTVMTSAQINRRARKIMTHIQNEVCYNLPSFFMYVVVCEQEKHRLF